LSGLQILVNLAEATVGLRKGRFGFWKARNLGNTLSANMVGLGLNFVVLFAVTRVKEEGAWEEQEFLWVSGGAIQDLNPQKALKALRKYWEIENRLFWVRDVDFSEDRLHGRKIGPGLSVIRSVAINLIRALGYRFIVDGFRALSARADRGLSLLIGLQP